MNMQGRKKVSWDSFEFVLNTTEIIHTDLTDFSFQFRYSFRLNWFYSKMQAPNSGSILILIQIFFQTSMGIAPIFYCKHCQIGNTIGPCEQAVRCDKIVDNLIMLLNLSRR